MKKLIKNYFTKSNFDYNNITEDSLKVMEGIYCLSHPQIEQIS